MTGRPVQAAPHHPESFLQSLQHLATFAAGRQAHRELVIAVHLVRGRGEQPDPGHLLQPLAVPTGQVVALPHELVQPPELPQPQGRAQFGEPIIRPQTHQVAAFCSHPVRAETAGEGRQPFVVRGEHAPLSAGHHFGRKKRKTRGIPQTPGPATPLGSPVGMGCVFEQKEVPFPAEGPDLVHIRQDQAADVHHHHPASLRRDLRANLGQAAGERRSGNIRQHRSSSGQQHGIGRGHEGIGRHDDLPARHLPVPHGDLQRRGAGVQPHRVLDPDVRGKLLLEALQILPLGQLAAAQNGLEVPQQGRDIFCRDAGPGLGEFRPDVPRAGRSAALSRRHQPSSS